MARPDRLPDEERLSRSISGAGVDSGDRRAAARPPCPRSRAAPDVKGPVPLGPTPATSATTWLTEPRPTSITTPMTKPDTPRKQPDGAGNTGSGTSAPGRRWPSAVTPRSRPRSRRTRRPGAAAFRHSRRHGRRPDRPTLGRADRDADQRPCARARRWWGRATRAPGRCPGRAGGRPERARLAAAERSRSGRCAFMAAGVGRTRPVRWLARRLTTANAPFPAQPPGRACGAGAGRFHLPATSTATGRSPLSPVGATR
jgi:hypothetical protein